MRTEAHFPDLDTGPFGNACACHECRISRRVEKVTAKLLGKWREKPFFAFSGSDAPQENWEAWKREEDWKHHVFHARKSWKNKQIHDDVIHASLMASYLFTGNMVTNRPQTGLVLANIQGA